MLILLLGLAPRMARAQLQRGDSDNNLRLELTDAVVSLNFLFSGGKAPYCMPAADANADGRLNLSDAIYLLAYLFNGGPAPVALTPAELTECGQGPADPESILRGWREYESPDVNGNGFSCATCHSLASDDSGDVLRAGYTLLNSLGRPSFKEGHRASYASAVNVCREEWMAIFDFDVGAYVPWAGDEPRLKDLVAFIESVSTAETAPALTYEIVAPSRTGPSTGSAESGCALFARACRTCHGEAGLGNALGPSLVDAFSACSTSPEPCLNAFCEPEPATCLDNPDYLRHQIRLSGPLSEHSVYNVPEGYELTGKTMPFWTSGKLANDEVEDLVAYLIAAREAVRNGAAAPACSSDPPADGAATRSGIFTDTSHGVAGTVEELDTHRLLLRGFSYNGGGIEVHLWLSRDGDESSGVAVGPDLFGRELLDATLAVEVPSEIASGDFDTVSIRCVIGGQDLAVARLAP